MAAKKATSILEIVRRADRGQLLTDGEQHLADIANAIEKHGGGKGSITIEIGVKAKGAGAYEFTTSLKAKIPEPSRLPTLLFRDSDSGDFSREDPRQPEFGEVVDVATRQPPKPQEQE